MIDKNSISMPEVFEGERATAVRQTHDFDQDLWDMAEKFRGKYNQHLSWIRKNNTINDVINHTNDVIQKWDNKEEFGYILQNKEGKTVGAMRIHSVDYKNHSAEFAYWLSPEETGNGYVGDTLDRLTNLLFSKDFVRMVIRCNVDNLPSNNIALRNGYELEGTLRKCRNRDDLFIDYNLYSKINPEYL